MISMCYILECNWNVSLKRAFVNKAQEKGWRDIFCINEDFEEKKSAFNVHFQDIPIEKLLVTQMSLLKNKYIFSSRWYFHCLHITFVALPNLTVN